MALSREAILASKGNRKPVRLEVPEWGGDVFVRVLSAKQSADLGDVPQGEVLGRVLIDCLCDEEGVRLFTDEDVAALMEEDAPVIMRVFSFAAKVNGLSTKELDEAMAGFGNGPEVA